MSPGTDVWIEGHRTVTQSRLHDIEGGGWIVYPPVLGCRYWNENEMALAGPAPARQADLGDPA